MQPVRRGSLWRRLSFLLALLLIPALCVFTAFAINLQVTSPYFTLSFGPSQPSVGITNAQPPVLVDTGGPNIINPPNAEPPRQNPPTTPENPNNPGTGNGCLLGLLCLNVATGVANVPAINVSLGKSSQQASGVASSLLGDGTCLLGVLCLTSGTSPLTVGAPVGTPAQGAGDCGAAACVDAALNASTQSAAVGASVEVPLIDTGASVGAGVNEEGVNVDADLNLLGSGNGNNEGNQEGINLNLLNTVEVGLGGSGGVNLNLNLPGLFP